MIHTVDNSYSISLGKMGFMVILASVLAVAGSARGQQTVGLADLIVNGTDVEVPSGIRAIIGPGVTVIPGTVAGPENTLTHPNGPKRVV